MRRARFIIPISIIIHLIIINGCLFLFSPVPELNYFLYFDFAWLAITIGINFYPTSRKETFLKNFPKLINLYVIFGLLFFGSFNLGNQTYTLFDQLKVFGLLLFLITLFRIFFYWYRKNYRKRGGNYVNVVVVGRDKNLKKIRQVFDEPELGYRYCGYFDNETSVSPTYLGEISASFQYIIENEIDQIFCMVSRLTKDEINSLINFADNNLKKLKIIPDNKEIFSKAMSIELYGMIPVINMRGLPLERTLFILYKRVFDIIFSSMVIFFVLSWLIPLLFILIKLESPGPLFFKQSRHGYNRRVFTCHKFRSMTVTKDANSVMATKNDVRVTNIGKFMRKTSIDELPQFLDVFLGKMSVVGPRPHMEHHTIEYQSSVDKYLVRHFVKPGITGLAQIKGYRGEIVNREDIINRVKFDIFYIENWSFYLDLDIIFHTVRNALKGEEKAY